VIGLPQRSLGRIKIRLQAKAGFTLVAGSTPDAISTFIQLHLVYNVLSIFKPVMALAAFNSGIVEVQHVRKFDSGSASTGKHRVIIQQNILWLSIETDRPQETSDRQNYHPCQSLAQSHHCSSYLHR
jgi:hypothetical protein